MNGERHIVAFLNESFLKWNYLRSGMDTRRVCLYFEKGYNVL